MKEKKRNKHKKKSKKEKHKKKKSYSSSSSSNEEEWVEKPTPLAKISDLPQTSGISGNKSNNLVVERDEWMSDPKIFSGITREDINKQKESKKAKEEKVVLVNPGQSDRELNPYWKDGGTGLPSATLDKHKETKHVGDQGAAWFKKALERAQEQAKEEKRDLEDVVAERWGSLSKLKSLIKEAEDEKYKKHYRQRDINNSYKKGSYDNEPFRTKEFSHSEDGRKYARYPSDKKKNFIKPEEERDYSDNYTKSVHRDEKNKYLKSDFSKHASSTSRQGWRKDTDRSKEKPEPSKSESKCESPPEDKSHHKDSESIVFGKDVNYLNEIGAKIIKAEMMGNLVLAAELKDKLEKAKKEMKKEEVLLTRTNEKGLSYPIKEATMDRKKASKRKIITHEEGKRVRYFADDDKMSLGDMFVREKTRTASDQDEVFARLMTKKIGPDESGRDLNDVFEETAAIDNEQREQNWEKLKAIKEHRLRGKVLENCMWCLETTASSNCIITIGQQIYLCVPSCQSLTDFHCQIVPIQHMTCSTSLDEDSWEEIVSLKKVLVQFYQARNEDVIFFESAVNLEKFSHMVINCVPVPQEVGQLAPMYFKKAIMECEMEWSLNKKLVDLSGKGVRRAIPKGLSYFSVSFGMEDGFAHVVEDKKYFPRNFAQEIIGGMMDLHHSVWRKPKREPQDILQKKKLDFIEQFQSYDPNKKTESQ